MSNDNHPLRMALSSRTHALTFSGGFLCKKNYQLSCRERWANKRKMKEYNTAAIETKKTFYTRYNSDKNTLPIELANKVDTPSLDGCTVYICCRRGGGASACGYYSAHVRHGCSKLSAIPLVTDKGQLCSHWRISFPPEKKHTVWNYRHWNEISQTRKITTL